MRFLLTLTLSAAVLLAQDAAQQRKNTIGEVQSNDTAAKQLKIKTDTGAIYTVTTGDKTNFLRVGADLDLKKATKIEPNEIHAGDRVLARGAVAEDTKAIAATSVVVMTKADVAQKQQKDREEWIKRGVSGTITAINPDSHEITIRVDTIPPKNATVETSEKLEYHRYAPDSVKFSDAKPSSFAELKVGDRLRALADKNEDGTRYKAEEIVSGSFRTLAAQVISVDPASNTMKVTDLSSKDKQPVIVHVNADTTVRRMPEMMARMLAARLKGQTANPGGGPAGPQGQPPAGGERTNRYRQEGAGASGGPAGAPPGGPAGNLARMGGPGGPGGGRGGDLHQMLERLPQSNVAELKPGDAIIISSTNGADRSNLMAITIVAGVEPFLAAAPRSAGALDLGSWNFDIGMPSQ